MQKTKVKIYVTIVLVLFFAFVGIVKNSQATTLLEANWDLGSTCSATNLRSGIWAADWDDPCTDFGIGTDGPGSKNYIYLKLPTSDASNAIYGNPSLANPSTMYVRFWFRVKQWVGGNIHPFWIANGQTGPYGFALWRGYQNNAFSMFTSNLDNNVFYYSGISLDTWYRLEYKIAGGGTSNGSVLARLDGTDITSSILSEAGGTLASHNGNLTTETLNYVYLNTYQDAFGSSGEFLDIAGLKITDGLDWIGGDASDLTPLSAPSGLSVQ